MSVSRCGKICITAPKPIRKKGITFILPIVLLLPPSCCGDAVCFLVKASKWVHNYKSVVKGIVHPKNENSVIIYSPSSSSKPVWMSLFCWTQRKIFWRMWETEQFWGTIDFHSIFFPMVPLNSLVTNFLQNISLCVRQNKESFGTTWGWVNYDGILIFGWTITLIYIYNTVPEKYHANIRVHFMEDYFLVLGESSLQCENYKGLCIIKWGNSKVTRTVWYF